MKNGFVLLLIAGVAAGIVSCKKKEIVTTNTVEVEPQPSLIGAWEGYYGSRGITNSGDTCFYEPTYPYSMVLESGGTAKVYNTLLADTSASSRAVGNWVYASNNTIYVDYTYVSAGIQYIIRARVDPKMHAINGKWHYSDNAAGGLFYMAKK